MVTHGFTTEDVTVQLFDMVTEAQVFADIARTDNDMETTNTGVIAVDFGTTPPNDIRCIITAHNGATVNDATDGTDVAYS